MDDEIEAQSSNTHTHTPLLTAVMECSLTQLTATNYVQSLQLLLILICDHFAHIQE